MSTRIAEAAQEPARFEVLEHAVRVKKACLEKLFAYMNNDYSEALLVSCNVLERESRENS